MGVLTSSQFDKRKKSDGIAHSGTKPSPTIYVPGSNILCRYRFPPAPMGECNAFHAYKEEEYKLPLVDQVFTFPKNWSGKKKQFYMKMLTSLGWENVSERITKPPKKEYTYFLMHPDHREYDGINGKVTVTVGKKEIELDCVEGIVTTEKKNVYQALMKKGFLEERPPRVKEE